MDPDTKQRMEEVLRKKEQPPSPLLAATPTEPVVSEPPTVQPTATQIMSINGTIFSRGGRNSVNLRAPGNINFNSPDGALVLTDLRQAIFDQFIVGQVVTITISTFP